MKKIASTILILLGIFIIVYPKANQKYNSYKEDIIIKQWEKDLQEMKDVKDEPIGNDNIKVDYKKNSQNISENATILKIDKIDLYMPVLEGETNENLKISPSHMKNTGKVGEVGNYVIAGHRSYTYGRHFNRLDEIEKGDKIQVISKGNVYIYKVVKKSIIKPEEVSVLNGNGKDKLITLITCHPIKVATHRLIIQGELESVSKYVKPISKNEK